MACKFFILDQAIKRVREAIVARRARYSARVLEVLGRARGGLTFEEVAARARLNTNTARGRLSELERAGKVRRRNGKRRSEGRRLSVYVVAEGVRP